MEQGRPHALRGRGSLGNPTFIGDVLPGTGAAAETAAPRCMAALQRLFLAQGISTCFQKEFTWLSVLPRSLTPQFLKIWLVCTFLGTHLLYRAKYMNLWERNIRSTYELWGPDYRLTQGLLKWMVLGGKWWDIVSFCGTNKRWFKLLYMFWRLRFYPKLCLLWVPSRHVCVQPALTSMFWAQNFNWVSSKAEPGVLVLVFWPRK